MTDLLHNVVGKQTRCHLTPESACVGCAQMTWVSYIDHDYVHNEHDSFYTRDGILAEKKFRISDDLFRIHLGRASISAKFRLILHQFRIIQDNSNNSGK